MLAALAQKRRLRPVFIQRKPGVQQIDWMVKTAKLKDSNGQAEHLLHVWLLQRHKDMLKQFLETLGLEHDEDGTVEDLPDSLDESKLEKGIEKLLAEHPHEEVAAYLHVFQLQKPGGFPELSAKLEGDERLRLGAAPEPSGTQTAAGSSKEPEVEPLVEAEAEDEAEGEEDSSAAAPESAAAASPEKA